MEERKKEKIKISVKERKEKSERVCERKRERGGLMCLGVSIRVSVSGFVSCRGRDIRLNGSTLTRPI